MFFEPRAVRRHKKAIRYYQRLYRWAISNGRTRERNRVHKDVAFRHKRMQDARYYVYV